MPIERVAIVGAGIAGLTTALSLAKHGIRSEIFEQAPVMTEVGAGLQISPNASLVLDKLGILEHLTPLWLEPEAIHLVSGLSLRRLASVLSGRFARDRWGSPYGVLHRATLQAALLKAVRENEHCTLHFGTKIGDESPIGDAGKADLLIGADGVWSTVRSRVPGAPTARFSGNIAFRFTVAADAAPDFADRSCVSAFLGPSAHLVCYPLRETQNFNMVAIVAGSRTSHEWINRPSENQSQHLLSAFSKWNKSISRFLEHATDIGVWPLYEAAGGTWQNGRDTVLIGDAAHAMMPFAAQGAAMAIEDAYELAALVANQPVPDALQVFEAQRMPRINRVRQRGAFNQFAYHARGPIRLGRNLVLAMKPPRSLATDLDWIYGYRVRD
ncbi:salicylate hydroxylase [Rhizobium sp. Root708]|uniref:FAD-dependent monooxygenase n=1 Tax=Rhizobium sp. Root708 TaxID=1736592 RepID=UPI0006FBEBEE|nr:FAD-dependent monooxygenase [Rhizobium sp. Root708]KRB53044.1 salicylate hydroxylase [Rhizobium sp. Root708]